MCGYYNCTQARPLGDLGHMQHDIQIHMFIADIKVHIQYTL